MSLSTWTCAIVGLVVGILFQFIPETTAIWNHLEYGSRLELNGYIIPAPWDASIIKSSNSVFLVCVPGRFRGVHLGKLDYAIYHFSAIPRNYPFNFEREAEIQGMVGGLYILKTINIGSVKHYCFEKKEGIQCIPDGNGLDIMFMGSASRITSFYALLSSIKQKSN